ncbi:16S ribosomal RNA methyltransferase RsmE [Spiroplasma clarkii]|nr:16S ribosomal RNA methyltransferase RsmE [Spiroplasma clarkii]
MKLKVGETILCIFQAEKYLGEIKELAEDFCLVELVSKLATQTQSIKINLIARIIREQKWDFVLQKATELGVSKIIPVEFSRNVVTIDPKKATNKIARWQAICVEAAKQSKRITIPEITPIVRNLHELELYQSDLKLVAWEGEQSVNVKKHLQTNFKTINIIVGPEGGLTLTEVELLNQLGYVNVGLGENILRAETASLFLISIINYEKN